MCQGWMQSPAHVRTEPEKKKKSKKKKKTDDSSTQLTMAMPSSGALVVIGLPNVVQFNALAFFWPHCLS